MSSLYDQIMKARNQAADDARDSILNRAAAAQAAASDNKGGKPAEELPSANLHPIDVTLHALFASVLGREVADEIQGRVLAKRAAAAARAAAPVSEDIVSKEYDAAMTDAKGEVRAPGPDLSPTCAGNVVSATDTGYDERYRRETAMHMAITFHGNTKSWVEPETIVRTAQQFYAFVRGDAK